MIKRMTLLARRHDITTAQFRSHWAGQHAQFAVSLNGVCKYTQNRAEETLWDKPVDDSFAIDGIVELFFENQAVMAQAQASEVGREVIPQDEPLFLHGWTLCIVETTGPHDHRGAKVIATLKFKPERKSGAEELLTKAALTSGAIATAINKVNSSAKRPTLWCEPIAPDLIFACWFEDAKAARTAFSPGGSLTETLDQLTSKGSVHLFDPLTIL